jgi:hypothetical protein
MGDIFHIGQRVALIFDGEDCGHGTVMHVWSEDDPVVEMDDGSFETDMGSFFVPLDEPDREPEHYVEIVAVCVLSWEDDGE